MSTYPLASTVACEDMRYPISRCGDCPYHFYHPFYEENILKNSGSDIEIKTIDSKYQQSSKCRLQKYSKKSSFLQKQNVPKNRKQSIFKDSGSDLEKYSKKSSSLQKQNVPKNRKENTLKDSGSDLEKYSKKSSSLQKQNVPKNRKENIFKDSGSDLEKYSKKSSSLQKQNVPKNRKENIFKDSGSDLEIKDKHSKTLQSSKNGLQKQNVLKNRTYTVNTICLEKPIRFPSLTKGVKPSETCTLHHNNYHRLRVIHSFMDKLESDYPSICTTGSIGRSLEGRDLKILRISNSNANNIAVWIDAGIHAREWIAPATAIYLADNIAKNFNTLPGFITNKDWYFLPVMNPDGYEYSHTKDRMWRKNKAWHKGQFVGVDLNRNFSYGWGGFGSSDEPTNVFYHGPYAFSEPESTAVRDMLLNSGTKFTVYLTLHSYGQVILFPFACKDQLCPSYVRLLEGATIMSRAIYNCNGNTYKVGISRDVMYGAAGTSNDWSYGVAGIPYCYLLELRSKKHRFIVPSEEIEETGKEILSSVIALMEFVDNYIPLKIGAQKVHEFDEEDRKSIKSMSTRGSRSTTKSTRSFRSTK